MKELQTANFKLQTHLPTFPTSSIYHHLHILCFISFGQFNFWGYDIIEANGFLTVGTNKVNMIIVVMALLTVFTKRITYRVIGGRNGMNDAFLNECLQGAVNGYPLKFLTCLDFNISVRQGIVMV